MSKTSPTLETIQGTLNEFRDLFLEEMKRSAQDRDVVRSLEKESEKIQKKLSEHDTQFFAIRKTLAEHDDQFVSVHKTLADHDKQFVKTHEQFIRIDKRFLGIDWQLSAIRKTLANQDELLETVASEVSHTQDTLIAMRPHIESHEERITRLEYGMTKLLLKS